MSNNSNNRCLICRNSISDFPDKYGINDNIAYRYHCSCCGFVSLSSEAVNYISTEGLISEKDKSIISRCLRLRFEQHKQKEHIHLTKEDGIKEEEVKEEEAKEEKVTEYGVENLTVETLKELISKYQPLAPLRKIVHFLQIVERQTKSVGQFADIKIKTDYSLFHCNSSYELVSLIAFLHKDELIDLKLDFKITDTTRNNIKNDNVLLNEKSLHDISSDDCSVMLTTKGLQRLKELTYSDKTDIFMESAMTLAQKADKEKSAAFEMVRIANEEKLKAEAKLKETLLLVEKIKEEKEIEKKIEQELEKERLKQELLEIVRVANIDRDNALETVKKYKALLKKNVAVSEITFSRLKKQEQAKDKALKEIERLKAERDKLLAELETAVKAKNRAEDEAKKAIIQRQKAFEEALLSTEEKKTALLIAQKATEEKKIALYRMEAALNEVKKEKAEKKIAIDETLEAKAAALKEKERLTAELKAAKQVADNALLAVKKAEKEKKEAESVAREGQGKVIDAEYKMEKALKALHKAEEEKRDALKIAYGSW